MKRSFTKILLVSLTAALLFSGTGCESIYENFFGQTEKKEAAPAQAPLAPKKQAPAAKEKEPTRKVVIEGMFGETFDSIYGNLQLVADGAGVNIVNFRKDPPSEDQAPNKQYLKLTLEGRIVDMSKFLLKLAQESIVYRVGELSLRKQTRSDLFIECSTDIELATYKYITLPQKKLKTEEDVAGFLENERVLTKNLAKVIYETYKLSNEEDFEITRLRYNRPGGTITGRIDDSSAVPFLSSSLGQEPCFREVTVKEVSKSTYSRDDQGTYFTLSYKLASP